MSPLTYYWIGIIALCIVMYVILDGCTLGMGVLWPFLEANDRDAAISVILPTWDGNQTWLVLGTASLYGAFAPAFSQLLPLLYIPILIMALSLLFRGVSLEFRLKAKKDSLVWNTMFFVSSVVATLSQGLMLGTFVQGFGDGASALYQIFLSPFSVMTAISLLLGYALLGATRLIHKVRGPVVARMQHVAFYLAWVIMAMMCLVSLWTPFIHPEVKALWFNPRHWIFLAWLPLITAVLFVLLIRNLYRKCDSSFAFWCAIGLFVCPYIGFCLSIYPYIVPYTMTIASATSPHSTMVFLSVGVTIMLPALLFYTFYAYRVFRGKVDEMVSY